MSTTEIRWPDLPVAQRIPWQDEVELARVTEELKGLPPLVLPGECDRLRNRLAAAERGEAFVLMAGDCAETFDANNAESLRSRLKTVLQMAVVLTYGAQLPVVKIGRLAGQYFKPRSKPVEVRDGVELPSYFGDAVNGLAFDPAERRPDPARLLTVYHSSLAALNLVRSFTQGGYADLRHVHAWNQDFVHESPAGRRYEGVANEIDRALAFMNACGVDPEEFRRVEFYSGHEGLSLDYEQALTRVDSRTGRPYDLSAHFVWIGERTRQLDGAHVEFFRRIGNPIGVKIGPTAEPAEVVELVATLDPDRVPGRLTLISRMGAGKVREVLPGIVRAVADSGRPVIWVCDPMHGNTRTAASGHKTRSFDDVVDEVAGFFTVMRDQGVAPGGLHAELTGDDVTECVGGTEGIAEDGLHVRYETACDPRLNREQSLELAFQVAESLARAR